MAKDYVIDIFNFMVLDPNAVAFEYVSNLYFKLIHKHL
jgi:hypothetical protein